MQIRFLDLGIVSPFGVHLFLGRRKSGKSTAIMSFLENFKDTYDFGLVFCGSAATAECYSKCLPATFIYDEIDEKILEKVIQRQERKIQEKNVKAAFILFDDVGFDRKLNCKIMKKLFMNGRHYKLGLIISLQYALSIGPSLRSNTDFVFACREKSLAYRKKLFEHFSICFQNFKQFDEVYKKCTLDYDIFVLGNALPTQSDKIEDNVFYWKAKFPLPEFRINITGAWWRLHRKNRSNNGPIKKGIFKQVRRTDVKQTEGKEKAYKKKSRVEEIIIPSVKTTVSLAPRPKKKNKFSA